ncbi:MAG: hypothetical protein GEU93_13100 [Propionibacteriales bacterium]|nr:hypothetical protein [Propionibacteriales bacterium]
MEGIGGTMGKGRRKATAPRWRRVAALLPLLVLSGAWSAGAAAGDNPVPAAADVPGVPEVPADIFDQAASVAMPSTTAGESARLTSSRTGSAITSATAAGGISGIPSTALSAYQRAATILNQADPGCNIGWALLAAIGRVESDHGRFGGNSLDAEGTARPGILGVPLNGKGGAARILDSDGGLLDNDPVYDRAVGPMQFIPATWRVAGVDANQDGTKDPQNIYDAATATAVYLCAGDEDLSTKSGQRTAVHRYNHSDEYVDLVMAIAAAYASGDFSAVPNTTPASFTLRPAMPPRAAADRTGKNRGKNDRGSDSGNHVKTGDGGGSQPDNENPRDEGPPPDNDAPPKNDPEPTPPNDEEPDPVQDTVKQATKPVQDTVIGAAKATQMCANKFADADLSDPQKAISACAAEITGMTENAAKSYLSQPLGDLLKSLGLAGLLCGLLGC